VPDVQIPLHAQDMPVVPHEHDPPMQRSAWSVHAWQLPQ
jgi:hypothetical protein